MDTNCARCSRLETDLAAATSRAEQAEHAAAIWEQRCSQATALSGQHIGEVAAALQRAEQAERARDDALFREAGADSLMRAVREELCQIADPAAGSVTIADILHAVRARVGGLSSDLAAARGERDRLRGELLTAIQETETAKNEGVHARAEREAARGERDRLRDLLGEIAARLENDDITYAQGCLMAKRIRAALEKSDGS